MRRDMTEAEYIAHLTRRTQDPEIQALVASWPPLEPDQLAVISRVFGGSARQAERKAAGEAA